MKPKIIAIVGPTASGKSDLAVAIAQRIGKAEIVSADSRQVYRGLDIGTGKITPKEMKGVPHYLLDVASPKRVFTAANYKNLAEKAIKVILHRKKIPIICGGTGLYIDALLYDYSLPAIPPQPKLRKDLEKKSEIELFTLLSRLDPKRAEIIDRFNKRRLVRALEIIMVSGKPVPPLKRTSRYNILKIGIKKENEELKMRVHKRLIKRMKQGMLEEVINLKKSGLSGKRLEDLGLEYRYLNRFLEGKISRSEMLKQLEKEILSYGKRQITWFKKSKDIYWVETFNQAVSLVKKFLKTTN